MLCCFPVELPGAGPDKYMVFSMLATARSRSTGVGWDKGNVRGGTGVAPLAAGIPGSGGGMEIALCIVPGLDESDATVERVDFADLGRFISFFRGRIPEGSRWRTAQVIFGPFTLASATGLANSFTFGFQSPYLNNSDVLGRELYEDRRRSSLASCGETK